ncbi:Carboxyvinyl-carboxyphosphonate phosphorylmutase [Methylobacterium crusticola]|uniref:Carboxyvinyl-carboxyphosphonate phosphorylmutase n=1 Tax=Methylobacterium crusticola TaxID=1697972 RepID=A0ABQ4R5G1_9HYPH|nr:isocitrate lyase/PEP mutase family protein [Methylobacterium crusticola]GJD52878.1 Carboxyvinyl-carboxyphosphonate phosphorylmutase [Methylobacterium crusticola]
MRQTQALRALLSRPEMIVAPGAYDGLSARFVAQAGYPAVYMTGAGTAAALGFPDFGLVTMGEMAANAGTLARAVAVPVIADADTGYGNELNVTRAVREYEMRGVAALHIEDQVSPKRCGHLDGKEIVPREEWLAKLRAALAARRDPDFLIVARTDARAVAGLDEAVARANAALAAGADMAFVEATRSLDEMAAVPARVAGPCLLNIVRGGQTPDVDLATAQAMGYRLAILPSLLLGAAMDAFDAALSDLRRSGRTPASDGAPDLRERFRRLGADEWDALRTRFRAPERDAAE